MSIRNTQTYFGLKGLKPWRKALEKECWRLKNNRVLTTAHVTILHVGFWIFNAAYIILAYILIKGNVGLFLAIIPSIMVIVSWGLYGCCPLEYLATTIGEVK